MKRYFASIIALFMLLMLSVPAFAATVATGPDGGFYHGALFGQWAQNLNRASRGEVEAEKANEDGTDGTIANLEMVNEGEADFAFVQLGGTALSAYPNVAVLGKFGYEAAHLVVPAGSKLKSCGDLEKKGNEWKIGLNTMGGSNVTMDVMTKVDKDYSHINRIDTLDSMAAEMSFNSGEIDAFFFVSTPGSGTVKEFQKGYKYLDCWDGDFDEFDVNKQQLYDKISLKKKQGYPNNFKTFSVPGVVVVNKTYMKENRKAVKAAMKATKQVYSQIKSAKKFNFYPED